MAAKNRLTTKTVALPAQRGEVKINTGIDPP